MRLSYDSVHGDGDVHCDCSVCEHVPTDLSLPTLPEIRSVELRQLTSTFPSRILEALCCFQYDCNKQRARYR